MKPGTLNEDARQVIAQGRVGNPAPDLVRARVRRSVTAKLLGGGVALSVAHASSLLAASGVKLGLAVTLAGTLGAGAWYGLSESASSTAASAVQAPQARLGRRIASGTEQRPGEVAKQPPRDPKHVADATPKVSHPAPGLKPSDTRALKSTESAPVARRATAHKTPETVINPGLTEEVSLLSDASTKLNQGDAQGALQLLRTYDQQFKTKMLIQERVATGVLVQCALGNVDGARTAAKRFHKSWPRSPLMRRISGSCAGDAVKR